MPVLTVTVRVSDARVIAWLHEHLGGHSSPIFRKEKPHHRDMYFWGLAPLASEPVLRALLPYFIIKKQQAEMALAFRTICRKRGSRLSPERLRDGRRFAVRLSVINHTGTDPGP